MLRQRRASALGLLLLLSGCGFVPTQVKKSASFYLNCPEDDMSFEQINDNRWGAAGCRKRLIFSPCEHDGESFCPSGSGLRDD